MAGRRCLRAPMSSVRWWSGGPLGTLSLVRIRDRDSGGAVATTGVARLWSPLALLFAVGPAQAAEPEPQRPETQPAPTSPQTPTTQGSADPFAVAPGGGVENVEIGPSDTRASDVHAERIEGLQIEVDRLKDRVFRSKARLALLRETVMRGVLSGSRVILAHRNLMGASFRLVRVVYRLDGAQIFARTDETGSLDAEDEVIVYDGNLSPGPHAVEIELSYAGHGYGVFAYLADFTFESKGTHAFTAPEDGAVKLLSVGYEEGNLTTEMAERPNVQWQVTPLDASGRPLPTRQRSDGKKK